MWEIEQQKDVSLAKHVANIIIFIKIWCLELKKSTNYGWFFYFLAFDSVKKKKTTSAAEHLKKSNAQNFFDLYGWNLQSACHPIANPITQKGPVCTLSLGPNEAGIWTKRCWHWAQMRLAFEPCVSGKSKNNFRKIWKRAKNFVSLHHPKDSRTVGQ